jgi:large subunit ribosomal protein L19|tara:strand:- start:13273 stop:13686 length:414 start_codon:yes stop_codon:yes gene_type:complete
MNTNNETPTKKEKLNTTNLINLVEAKYLKENIVTSASENKRLEVGDILRVGYTIYEGTKERVQFYEGLVIAKQNRGLGKSFTLRRTVQGIGVEQVFLLNSPKIVSITKKQSSKVRRAKLYFIRALRGKATRLKRKFN